MTLKTNLCDRVLRSHRFNVLLDALHQPLGGRGGAADADRLHAFKPFGLQLGFDFDEVCPRVRLLTDMEQDFPVRADPARDEEHHVVARSKLAQFLVPPEDLAANRILRVKFDGFLVERVDDQVLYPLLEFVLQFRERGFIHRRLGEEHGLPVEVDLVDLLQGFDDHRFPVRLPDESDHLGVIRFSVDHHLVPLIVKFLDPFLHLPDHRAGRVDESHAQLFRGRECRGRLAVSADQDFPVFHGGKVGMGDRLQAPALEALDLPRIMDDLAEHIERFPGRRRLELRLRDVDRPDHTPAKPRALVDAHFHVRVFSNLSACSITYWTCSSTVSFDVSRTIASSAFRRGLIVRLESFRSRSSISFMSSSRGTSIPRSCNSFRRRAVRSSTFATRKIFRSASGTTTVPMSRPSITTPPSFASRRCCSTITSRTFLIALIRLTALVTAWLRIEGVTSRPFTLTLNSPFDCSKLI